MITEGGVADILIIDDCRVNRMALRLFLEKYAHRVSEAETGAEGERMFLSQHYDLVFMDIFMPDQDGIETIVNIRKVNKSIPIVAMSAGGSSQDLVYLNHSLRLGANHAVSKPLSAEGLSKIMNNINGGLQ